MLIYPNKVFMDWYLLGVLGGGAFWTFYSFIDGEESSIKHCVHYKVDTLIIIETNIESSDWYFHLNIRSNYNANTH